MSNLRSFLWYWCFSVLWNCIKDFGVALKHALAKNFNTKFLMSVGVILVIAAVLSTIILSFMHSTRLGWWCLLGWVTFAIIMLIALLTKDTFWQRLKKFASLTALVLTFVLGCYLLGTLAFFLLPPVNHAEFMLEQKLAMGLICLIFLTIIGIVIHENYTEGKVQHKWQNITEYNVYLLRQILIVSIGIVAIWLAVHYLKPMVI